MKDEKGLTVLDQILKYVRLFLREQDTKYLFLFICVNATFMVVEFWYGFSANSLGLISDGCHTLFDCIALSISLFAMVFSRRSPCDQYSYGYERHEVLSAFANACFLMFVALFLFMEALHRLPSPPEVQADGLFKVAAVGMVVKISGIHFIRRYRYGERFQATPISLDSLTPRSSNLELVFLHLLADAGGSMGVAVSSWLVGGRGLHVADPLVSMAIALLIMYSVWPLFIDTGKILLQTTPPSIRSALDTCLREASTLEGVLECHEEHFWTQAPGVFVGTLSVRVRADCDEQRLLKTVSAVFQPYIAHLSVQVEKDPPIDWLLPQAGGGGLGGVGAGHAHAHSQQGHGHSHGDDGQHGHSHSHGGHGHSHGGAY